MNERFYETLKGEFSSVFGEEVSPRCTFYTPKIIQHLSSSSHSQLLRQI